MDTKVVLVILACMFCYQVCSAELQLVQALFRHGNRTPTDGREFYHNDPYGNMTFEPIGKGGLTNAGKMLIYKLGQFLRHRYEDFLGKIYSNEIIRFRANEVDRIVMTAQLVAAGLYPPTKIQTWNPDLKWQPIPVWMQPLMQDSLYNSAFCSNYRKWRAEIESTDPYLLKRAKKYKPLFEYLSNHTGSNITQARSFFLRQQLVAEKDIGLRLPEWTKSVFPGELDKVAADDCIIQSYTLRMKQLAGGQWLREWMGNVDRHLNSTSKLKAYMYAGHDLNIGSVLVALGSYDNKVPSYGSCIMFELYKIGGKHFVKFHHKADGVFRTLEVPGCKSKLCPLEVFRKIIKPLIPSDPKKLCGEITLNLF